MLPCPSFQARRARLVEGPELQPIQANGAILPMIRIVHFTDTHLDASPELRTRREADLANHVDAINALEQQPDLVIFTGDMANTGQSEEYAIARQHLNRLHSRWVFVPGNRDSRRCIRETFGDLGFLPMERDAPLDFAVEVGPLTFIGFDSKGQGTNKGAAPGERLAALRAMLEAVDGRPAIVSMHHPPFELHEIPWPRQFEDWAEAEAMNELIAGFDNVKLVACGHAHRRIAGEVGGKPAWTMLCAASDLRKGPAKDLGADVALQVYEFSDDGDLRNTEMLVLPVDGDAAAQTATQAAE